MNTNTNTNLYLEKWIQLQIQTTQSAHKNTVILKNMPNVWVIVVTSSWVYHWINYLVGETETEYLIESLSVKKLRQNCSILVIKA